jgi:hypothetical protein
VPVEALALLGGGGRVGALANVRVFAVERD